MKKNKKLPKYNIGRSRYTGYQRNMGIGAASFNSQLGENLGNEVNAMRLSLIPNAIARLGQNAQYPLLTLLNTVHLPATISGFTTVANPLASTATNAASNFTTNFAGLGLGASLLNNNAAILDKVPQATVSAGKTVLNTAGKVAAVVGTAYGAYNVMNNIMRAGDTIATGQIADTRGTNMITTAGGNTYTEKTGPDGSAAMDYEKQAKTAKQTSLIADTTGFGASAGALAGSIIPGLGNLAGMGIGAALGFIGGGLADLFGFGDNEEEVNNRLKLVTDVTSMQNRQSEGLAKNQDVRDEFYGSAANGKMPGFHNGKANARVSNGEVVGNFEDGYFRVPGGKNNKDSVKTHLGKEDFVISNKHGLSDYAWLTGDIPGALAALSYLQKTGQMNKYKNGRLPKFDDGTKRKWSDVVFSTIPYGISAAQNLTQLLRALNADIYAPDFYVENPEGAKAVNTLASLRFDANPYYRQALRGLNQANWDARRLVGLGAGGRALAQNANYVQYLSGIRDITKMYNEADNAYKEKYAAALANLGSTNQGRRMQAAAQRHQFLQQANAAKENWMAQYRKNIDTNLLNAASEYMKWGQYNDSLGIQNKMLELYDRQAKTDELKANAYINSLGNNTTQNNSTWTPPMWLQRRGYIPSTYDTSGFNWSIRS